MSGQGQVKSKQRVADFGEVFTAEREVNAMLDLVESQFDRVDATFLDPACGTGNFLLETLRRKLATADRISESAAEFERNALMALASVYGVEIQFDNVVECRQRLLDSWIMTLETRRADGLPSDPAREKAAEIVWYNIVLGDFLTSRRVDSAGRDTGKPIIVREWECEGDMPKKKKDEALRPMNAAQPLLPLDETDDFEEARRREEAVQPEQTPWEQEPAPDPAADLPAGQLTEEEPDQNAESVPESSPELQELEEPIASAVPVAEPIPEPEQTPEPAPVKKPRKRAVRKSAKKTAQPVEQIAAQEPAPPVQELPQPLPTPEISVETAALEPLVPDPETYPVPFDGCSHFFELFGAFYERAADLLKDKEQGTGLETLDTFRRDVERLEKLVIRQNCALACSREENQTRFVKRALAGYEQTTRCILSVRGLACLTEDERAELLGPLYLLANVFNAMYNPGGKVNG